MAQTRADYVPAEPIRRAIKEWLTENGYREATGNGEFKDRYHSPLDVLSTRTGLRRDSILRHSWGDRGYRMMQFDTADKFLCATDRFNWWWDDPELSECYERAAKGADRVYPIVEPEPVICSCEYCGDTFEIAGRHGSVRRFCSQKCRQAAHKARKVAA